MKITFSGLVRQLGWMMASQITIIFSIKKSIGLTSFKFYFSQLGEDIILLSLLKNKSKGFYIDVGCNEPIQYNNTFYFYLRGWQGINIDANEHLIRKFKRVRPKDISLCAAISEEDKELNYYISKDNPEVNTTDYDTYLKWKDKWNFDQEKVVKTQKLDTILKQYLKPEQKIDFLSIDVEGNDLSVLRSMDLNRYRPEIILIEIHDLDLESVLDNKILSYLKSNDYAFIGYVVINAYFKDNRNISRN